jgi:hypothetical protein
MLNELLSSSDDLEKLPEPFVGCELIHDPKFEAQEVI